MANTYTQLLYHVVFSTKRRVPCMDKARRADLYAYLWGIHKTLKCHLYRIGGVDDHVHLFTSIHPKLAVADYVEKIKTGSTSWIRREAVFAEWPGWQDGYGAFTAALENKTAIVAYIIGQEEHHRTVSFVEEFRALLEQAGIDYDPKYLA